MHFDPNLRHLSGLSHELYKDYDELVTFPDDDSESFLRNIKLKSEYMIYDDAISKMDKQPTQALAIATKADSNNAQLAKISNPLSLHEFNAVSNKPISQEKIDKVVNSIIEQHDNIDESVKNKITDIATKSLIKASQSGSFNAATGESKTPFSQGLLPMKTYDIPKPKWHPPWKLMRVISGHTGWVRCVAVDPSNTWFATGSADRMIKIWDLAKGTLKLSLTGHISTVRGVAVSDRHPYLFSCGEDKTVKCWDLEQNKVVRHYHGHLSGVYCLSIHPTLDILVSGGRDSVARVWDMRTKSNIHTLTGHTNTVASLLTQAPNPQVITGSHDSTIRYWDLVAGKSFTTLTNHKKSVRSMALHPTLFCMASGAPDNIKQWKFPNGDFMQNLSGHNAVVNALAINMDNVVVSGGDNGSMHFWDWKSGHCFQQFNSLVQPGSLDSEAGIFAMTFDHSSSRLLTCEADKTIKIYKEDETATEETHPIDWKPNLLLRKRF